MKAKMNFNMQTVKKGIETGKIKGLDLSLVNNTKNIRKFDKAFTFQVFQDIDPENYYNILSCEKHIHHVKIPMLCINSRNDPISKYLKLPSLIERTKFIPKEVFLKNENLILAETPRGGHCEFFTGLSPRRVDFISGISTLLVSILILLSKGIKSKNINKPKITIIKLDLKLNCRPVLLLIFKVIPQIKSISSKLSNH